MTKQLFAASSPLPVLLLAACLARPESGLEVPCVGLRLAGPRFADPDGGKDHGGELRLSRHIGFGGSARSHRRPEALFDGAGTWIDAFQALNYGLDSGIDAFQALNYGLDSGTGAFPSLS